MNELPFEAPLSILHNDTAGQCEVPVEPGVPQSSPITLNTNLEVAVGRPPGHGLHLQHWGVGVGSDYLETGKMETEAGWRLRKQTLNSPPGLYLAPTVKATMVDLFL